MRERKGKRSPQTEPLSGSETPTRRPAARSPGVAPGPGPPSPASESEAGVPLVAGGRDARAFHATRADRRHPGEASLGLHGPARAGAGRSPSPRLHRGAGPPRLPAREGGAEPVRGKGRFRCRLEGARAATPGVKPRRHPSGKQGNPGSPGTGKSVGAGRGDAETPERVSPGKKARAQAAPGEGAQEGGRTGEPSLRPRGTPQRSGFARRAPETTQGGGGGPGSQATGSLGVGGGPHQEGGLPRRSWQPRERCGARPPSRPKPARPLTWSPGCPSVLCGAVCLAPSRPRSAAALRPGRRGGGARASRPAALSGAGRAGRTSPALSSGSAAALAAARSGSGLFIHPFTLPPQAGLGLAPLPLTSPPRRPAPAPG